MAKGLGRGLGALIPSAIKEASIPIKNTVTEDKNAQGVVTVDIKKIKPDPNQPRKHFDHHALQELMESIKQYGILQPLVVTPKDTLGMHHLIAGERRLRASEMLGEKKVPVIIREVKEQEKLALAIVENIQRSDLNPIEEAYAYQRLMNEFNLNQDEVAKKVGKSRSGIANILRLIDLPIEVQKAVADGNIKFGHAKILASLASAKEQADYAKKILNENLSVRDLEQATIKSRRVKRTVSQSFDPIREAQEEMVRERLGTKVQIKKVGDKGQIIIHFYSLEELQRLLNELT